MKARRIPLNTTQSMVILIYNRAAPWVRLAPTTLLLLSFLTVAAHAQDEGWGYTYDKSWIRYLYPQDVDKWWWDDDWWQDGRLELAQNHEVIVEQTSYEHDGKSIPAHLFRPADGGSYPAVYFQHGRRGLDEFTLKVPERLAARGFTVLAPDLWFANFIDKFPIEHDPVVEADAAAGIDFLLQQEHVSTAKACALSHTRGGYITLKALVTHGRQELNVACWVSYYPHMQDPNAAEPMQVYRYAPEADALSVPALIFLGEHDQYQRVRPIVSVYEALKADAKPIWLIVYPGVGRGFDFRPPTVRTFADDLATKDSVLRAAQFIKRYLVE